LADVLGDVIAAQRDDGGVRQRSTAEHADVGRASADVDEQRGELVLTVVEDGEARGQRLYYQAVHHHAGVIGAASQVLEGPLRPGNDVDVDLEPHARHADWIFDAVVTVD